MNMRALKALALLLTLPFAAPILNAQADAAPQDPPVIRSARREVLVDVVVRDKHHHIVTDLRPEEFQVYEEGALQKLNAFRNVAGAEELQNEQSNLRNSSSGGATSSSPSPATSLRQLNFVAVVLAEIGPRNLQ